MGGAHPRTARTERRMTMRKKKDQLVWTTEPPKQPGYYWCRYKGSDKSTWSPAYIPAVADLTQYGGLEESEQVEWAGPIPEPREPK